MAIINSLARFSNFICRSSIYRSQGKRTKCSFPSLPALKLSPKSNYPVYTYSIGCLGSSKSCYSTISYSSVTSNKLEVNGVNIHYERTGTGDHAVLLLPGALGCSQTDFQPQLNGLSKEKYTIIAFDPRGYGKSRPPDRDWPLLFFDRDAKDAAALMKKLDFTRYSVLGWSDGGNTGLVLAGMFPGNVRKLLIWGSNSHITEKDIEMYTAVANIDDWSERMRAPFLEIYGEEYFRSQWTNWIDAIKAYYKQRNGDICVGSLPNVKCETLIVNGHKDVMVPQEHPLFLQKHIPNCRMIDWPEGKHNLHLKHHKEFNQLAEEFLDKPE